ncbi:MAG: hypothetical protein IKN81_09090 [Oscillospiraceae bacterium]|nr:hypothetical protein [Oscillospiraceae bacterium]
MKKGIVFALLATLAAGAAAALWLQNRPDGEREAPEGDPEISADNTVSTHLKSKYVDYSAGGEHPRYLLELETPDGVKEIAVTAEQYEDCYIGDEVLCVVSGGRYCPI